MDLRDRDLARRDNLFVIEGHIALERAILAGRFALHSVLLLDARREALSPALAQLSPTIPVYLASQDVMDRIAGFHLHRGVLALAHRPAARSAAEELAALPTGPASILGLVGLSNHDNVGACFRNAAAFGVGAVLLDAASCDPLYRKSIRVSSGTALSLPFAHGGHSDAMMDALREASFECWALTPRDGEPLQVIDPPDRLALLLGAEGPGLPEALMRKARRVTIPMSQGLDSLNVATAGAIALAHVHARRRQASP
jgi:tRNA G18 (ribose-2'-O)-methylase SpoU